MAGMLWLNGPIPESGDLGYCTLCTMLYKGAVNQTELVKQASSDVNAMGLGEHKTLDVYSKELGQYLPDRFQPQPAVTLGVSPIIQQIAAQLLGIPVDVNGRPMGIAPPVVVPLCWSHMFGLVMSDGGHVVPASADQMPPEPQMRGAVDLGRRRSG